MSKPTAHVIGGGMAGLAAATKLTEAGIRAKVYEAAPLAGGRCRSYFDPTFNCVLDNGNHLVFSGNREIATYLRRTGGQQELTQLPSTVRFLDAGTQETWEASLETLFRPWTLIRSKNRVPKSHVFDYLRSLRILSAPQESTVEGILSQTGELYRRFWEPLSVAVLNTEPSTASAHLLNLTLKDIVHRGRGGCVPLVATTSLAATFVDPACIYIQENDGEVLLEKRCIGVRVNGGNVVALQFRDHDVVIEPSDPVIIAVQQSGHDELLGLKSPSLNYRPIVNVHFRALEIEGKPAMTGIIDGTAEWVFVRGDLASVTISSATNTVDMSQQEIVDLVWKDVRAALQVDLAAPEMSRVIKEKRATPEQSASFAEGRQGVRTGLKNCWRAGDWTATGLPATIEGAIKSGHIAANAALENS